MKLTIQRPVAAVMGWIACIAWISMNAATAAQGFTTTTVQGTVYLADGRPGSGVLQLSWPAFTTASNQSVAAGRTTVQIGADGYVSVKLAPNLGSTPAGLYYTAVYHLADGTVSTEYWVVPAAAQAIISQVRAQVMPAAQAVQAVSKGYVDQSIAELTQSLLTASGGSLSGPLFLNGDPSQPTQAATKRYVDDQVAKALPASGGAATGPLTSVQLGAAYQADQFPGTDFGARLQACVSKLDPTFGGTCDARNFTGTQGAAAAIVISAANATVLLPCATIATSNQIRVTPGTRNVTLRGCSLRGASDSSGSQGGTVFLYSGAVPMIQIGDPAYAVNTLGFHIDNVVINTTASSSAAAQAMAAYRTQELDLQSLYLLGNSNQTGMTLDGTGNYTGGTLQDIEFGGFGTALNGIGHQVANAATTDWVNASTFLRLHINCPTSNGSPIAGTYGINLQQGDGNTFTGGDVEGCATALHLGPNAQNNTIVGLRNENSINQVVADAGSSYNNWITGGTMFAGQLTDNGARNSFLDTFHRSFNGLNGDWYGSQTDTTITNHYRLGTGTGNERGLLNRYQTDYGYRWTMGLSDASSGAQFYQLLDELNNVYRLSVGQYNHGQSSTNNQTVLNAAGTGAVVLNGSSNAGTGGVIFGSGGPASTTVATINNAGNAQFNGTLQVSGASIFSSSTTVKNQADAEIDSVLWAGSSANQKESFIYKDYSGASQWYMVKDASNNWALNSALGGLDSFKAYQSNNSGDTYINASNGTGHIRLNYESGAGAETDIYSGPSSTLVAAFLGNTAIKFPGLAAASGRNCLQIDNSGYISNTGTACGTGTDTNGTVNLGSAGQVAYYAANGTVIAGTTSVAVTAGGTGATTAAQALQNLGAHPAMPGVAPDGAAGITVSGAVAASAVNMAGDSPKINPASGANDYAYLKCNNEVMNGYSGGSAGWQHTLHNCMNLSYNFGAPGYNFGTTAGFQAQHGPGGWSVGSGLTINGVVNTPGISEIVSGSQIKASIGDAAGMYLYPRNYGGAIAGSDEGQHMLAAEGGESNSVYTGTVNLGGNGATTVKVNCANDCAYPGDGRYLINLASAVTGNVIGKTPSNGSGSASAPGTFSLDISVTPSTFWGALVADIKTPVNSTGLIGVGTTAMTFAVNGGGVINGVTNAGSPQVGDFICFSGDYHEQASITGVSGTGPWTVTASLRHSHSAGSYIMANGACGKFLAFNANITHPQSQDLRYPIDIIGALDAHTLVYRTFVMNGGTGVSFGNVVFPVAGQFGRAHNDGGGTVTFDYGYGWAHPEMAGQAALTISGTGTAFDGVCTNPMINAAGNVSCTQTASNGVGVSAANATVAVGTSVYGNTGFMMYDGAETLDVLDYTTSPASVSPGNVTTFTLEPNKTNWAASNPVEQVHHYIVHDDGERLTLYVHDPHRTQLGVFGAEAQGAGIYGGNLANPTANWSFIKATNDNAASMYVGHGGTVYPPGAFFAQGLMNSGMGMQYAPEPTTAGSTGPGGPPAGYGMYIGCPINGCTADPNFLYAVFGAAGNGAVSALHFDPNGRRLIWNGVSSMDFSGAPIVRPTIQSYNSGTVAMPVYAAAQEIYKSIDSGGNPHTWTISAPQTGGGYTLTLPQENGTIATTADLATNFGASGASHKAGLVPDPGASAGATKYLREDGTWNSPPGSGGMISTVPANLQFLGDGSDGAYTCTSGSCTITWGEHWYSSFNVSAGATLTMTGGASSLPTVIRSNGTCTIAGTTSQAVFLGGASNYGGPGGGGGGGTGAGSAGFTTVGGSGGGTAGAASGGNGGNGGNGTSTAAEIQKAFLSGFSMQSMVNGITTGNDWIGGAAGGAGGSSGPAGGLGGGTIIIVCGTINFTGTIDVHGGNGANSTGNNVGASGGGGGGIVILRSPNLTNSGTINVSGGTGGSCLSYTGCGTGGNGANGWSYVFSN